MKGRSGSFWLSAIAASLFLGCAPVGWATPITGKYQLTGRSVGLRLEPNHKPDRHITRMEATAKARRRSVVMALKGTDESNETYRCGWKANFKPPLKHGGRRQVRKSVLDRLPCNRSRWTGTAKFTWKKRAGEYRLSIRIEVDAVAGRDTGDSAKINLNGKHN